MTEPESKELLELAEAATAYLHAVTEARRTGKFHAWEEAKRKGAVLQRLCDKVLSEERTLF